MVFLFRDKSISSVFFLILLCFGVHAHLFINTPQVVVIEGSGLISSALSLFVKDYLPQTAVAFIYIAIVLLQAIRLNLVMNELRMYNQSGFTTGMAYILLTAFFPQWSNLTPAILANTFVIWIFIQLSKLYTHPSPKTLLFNTGLIVGASVLCYHPTGILIVVVLFALAIVRTFLLSEWLVLLLGIFMPFYLVISYFYLNNKMTLLETVLPYVQLNLPVSKTEVWFWINLATMIFMLVAGIIFWSKENSRMVIQIRKTWAAMMVMVFIMLPVPFIFSHAGMEAAALSLVPLAGFIANIFIYPKKLLLPNLLFILAIVIVIHNNWLLIKN